MSQRYVRSVSVLCPVCVLELFIHSMCTGPLQERKEQSGNNAPVRDTVVSCTGHSMSRE